MPHVPEALELENEVRAVARKIDRCRRVLGAPLVLAEACASLGLLPAGLGCFEGALLLAIVALAFALLALPYLIALPFIALYRQRYQRRLRLLLARLPELQRAGVLHSLAYDSEETRALVAPALRRLNLPCELSPSAPAAGRGDEVSSIGHERGRG